MEILSAQKLANGWYHHIVAVGPPEAVVVHEFTHPALPKPGALGYEAALTEAVYLARIRAEIALLVAAPAAPVPLPL